MQFISLIRNYPNLRNGSMQINLPLCKQDSDDYVLSGKKLNIHNEVILRNDVVQRVNKAKFLGAIFDLDLKD